MERKFKTPIYLVMAISLLLPLLSAYMNYYVLMEADLLSACRKFENTDLDCLLLFKKEELTALTGFSCTFLAAGDLIGFPSSFYSPVVFPQVRTLILRC